MRRVTMAFTVATAGMAATAATAHAATLTITPAKACYLAGESITATGAGFTAGSTVNFQLDGAGPAVPFTADAAGNVSAALRLPRMDAAKAHTLTARDAAGLAASAGFMGTTHQIASRTNRGRPGKKVKLRGYGFLFGPKAYMHVRGHGIRSDVFLARPKAPCGTFTVRKRFVRAGAPFGKYRLQFDAKKRYSKKTQPKLVYTLTVFRRFSAAAAFTTARQVLR